MMKTITDQRSDDAGFECGSVERVACSAFRSSFERDDQLFFGVQRNRIDLQAADKCARRSPRADIETTGMQRTDKGPLAENSVSERPASVRTLACVAKTEPSRLRNTAMGTP